MGNNYESLDFLHTPQPLPSVQKNSISKFGIFLSLSFILSYLVYEIYRVFSYTNNYIVNYSQDFQRTNIDIKMNATFGFQIGDNLNDFFEFEFFDSKNIKIDNNIKKICDSNLKEIKEIK